jgi:hypothetical protein
MIVYEKLEIGPCPFCPREDWLLRDGETGVVACGVCTRKLFLTNARGIMSPDDLNGKRELRFKHGSYHVILTAALDGTGNIIVTDDFHEKPEDQAVAKEAVRDAVKMLSIARHIAWKEFVKLGGSAEELRDDED